MGDGRVGVGRVEVVAVEEQVVRAVAIVVRGRPVAVGTDADHSPGAVACGRQEDCTIGLKRVRPSFGGDDVAVVAGGTGVRIAQRICGSCPVVGQQDDTVHVVHRGLGIEDAAAGVAGVDDIVPLWLRQRAPTAVHRIAAVADGVVAPVGLAVAVVEVGTGAVIGIVLAINGDGAPRLPAGGDGRIAVDTARAPAEKVSSRQTASKAWRHCQCIAGCLSRNKPAGWRTPRRGR